MDKRIKIGVTPLYDADLNSIWMLPGYLHGIEQAGGIPVILPLTADRAILEQLCQELDGFLVTGGQDIEPVLYGQERLPFCGEACRLRDELEQFLISRVLELDKPLLGICRGMQILNCVQGGTLYQDLPTQLPNCTAHHQTQPYTVGSHPVALRSGTMLAACAGGAATLFVNTIHHQGIERTAPGAVEAAKAPDGLVEAIEFPAYRMVMGVQWHPEYLFREDEVSRRLFSLLVTRCATQK